MKKKIVKGAGGWSSKKVPGMYQNGGQFKHQTLEITDEMRRQRELMDSLMRDKYGPNWQKKWQQEQMKMNWDSLRKANPDFFKLMLANLSKHGNTPGTF